MSFSDYLRQQNIPENASPETIARHKIAYQKLQQKAKRDRHRARYKRLELSLEDQEWQLLKHQAQLHQMAPSVFAKTCIHGYLEQMFVVPDEATVKSLEQGIRKIGNNVNQLVMHTHTHRSISEQTIRAIRDQITRLERLLTRQFREPTNLSALVRQALQAHPNYARVLQRLIDQPR